MKIKICACFKLKCEMLICSFLANHMLPSSTVFLIDRMYFNAFLPSFLPSIYLILLEIYMLQTT